jgi:hypothetical protein
MKRNLWKSALAGCLMLAGTFTVTAGPLQRTDVTSDPVWVLHVDCDALKQTVVGKYVLGEMEKPEAQKKLAAFQAIFNLDLRTALHGLTLYGTASEPEDGVLLVYADFDPARLTTLAEGAKEHKSTTRGNHTIHSWLDEKKAAKDGVKPRTYAAIHNGKVIFAQKESRVVDALDVLDRIRPNLSASPAYSDLGANGDASFIVGAARKIELPSSDPNAAVLKQSKMVWLSVGEAQGQARATLKLEANSEEVAKQIESIGRGLLGLMALQSDKPEAVKLSQALAIQQEGAGVIVKLALPADDVVEMMKAGAAKKAAQN